MAENETGNAAAVEAALDHVFGGDAEAQASAKADDAQEGERTSEQSGGAGEASSEDSSSEGSEKQGLAAEQVSREAQPSVESGVTTDGLGEQGQDRDDDLEKLRKELRTQGGRVAAAEARERALADELAVLRTGKSSSDRQAASDSDRPQPVELPEDLVEDAKEFEQLYPRLAPLLRQAGPEGDRVRRVLRESGADIAALAAENVMLRQEIQTVDTGVKARSRQEQQAQLTTRHPEVSGAFAAEGTPERQSADAFLAEVEGWIKGLPYGEAAPKMQALQHGTFEQAAALFDEFKQTTKPQKTGLDADTRKRAQDAGGVDQKRGSRPPAGKKNGPEAAFEAVYGDN